MRKNLLFAILLVLGTSIIWTVICWNWWGRTVAKNATTEIQKQDSVINYNAGEYQMLLEEQLELQEQLNYYELAQSKLKTTYHRNRSAFITGDSLIRVDVVHLVKSCDSVIASDSLIINNLKEQLNIEARKIDNLQEVVVAYEQKADVLTEEINTLNVEKKKLEKQKRRRNRALVVSSSVAILSTFVLAILL
jgi:septal ring factor EnvC (AmiA/AmiB activator)